MIVTKKSHWNCLRPKNMILLDDLEQIIERVCPSDAYEQNHLWDRKWRLLFYNKKKLVKIIFFVKLIQVRENSYSHFEMVISTTPDINKNRGGCIVSYLGPNHLPKYLFLGYVLKS